QRTKIKQYVTTRKVAPATLKEKVNVGAPLPADGRLRAVPAEWGPGGSKYRYFYSDNHVYFVEPSTRKVVTVVFWRGEWPAHHKARRLSFAQRLLAAIRIDDPHKQNRLACRR